MFSTTKIRNTVVAVFAALVALALPVSAMAIEPLQWANEGPTNSHGQPVAGNPAAAPTRQNTYTLTNRMVNPYRERAADAGLELVGETVLCAGWGCESPEMPLGWYLPTHSEGYKQPGEFNRGWQWQFVRQPGPHATTQIPATEPVALYNTFFDRYDVKLGDGGALSWSSTPRYEWQVAVGDSTIPIVRERETELYNTSEQGYLIFPEGGGLEGEGPGLSWVHARFSIPKGYVAPMPVKTGPVNATPPPAKEVPPVTTKIPLPPAGPVKAAPQPVTTSPVQPVRVTGSLG